jgi:hypothetical protein
MQGEYHFKVILTTDIAAYTSRTNIPLASFFNRMKVNIAHDLNLVLDEFELVDVGQPDGEFAPPIDISTDNRTVFQRYGHRASFYIRMRNTPNQDNQTALASTQIAPTNTTECGICQSAADTCNYDCSHRFCATCIRSCTSYGISRCPMCRAQLRTPTSISYMTGFPQL